MLSTATYRHIQELLARGGLSQRAIARQLGVSRNTVGGIARGERPDYDAMRRVRERREVPSPGGSRRRCPTCGALVRPPCVACRVRDELARMARSARPTEAPGDDRVLNLALRPQHQARYEQVRARRLAEEARKCA